jgi:hypothetical protein
MRTLDQGWLRIQKRKKLDLATSRMIVMIDGLPTGVDHWGRVMYEKSAKSRAGEFGRRRILARKEGENNEGSTDILQKRVSCYMNNTNAY